MFRVCRFLRKDDVPAFLCPLQNLGKTVPIPYRSGYPPPQMSSRNRSFDRRSASQDCASSAEPPVRLR